MPNLALVPLLSEQAAAAAIMPTRRRSNRTSMPQSSVRLADEFDTPHAAGFFPSVYGYSNPFGNRTGNWYFYALRSETSTSPRMQEGGMRFYADEANTTDDDFRFTLANIPTGRDGSRAGPQLTTICVFRITTSNSATQYVFKAGGHDVLARADGTIRLGWQGGNGYNYYGSVTRNCQDGAWHTVVQSTRYNTVPSVSVDGLGPPETWTGNLWYVGHDQGTIGAENTMSISGPTGYPEYYHMDGIVRLAITLPGIFVGQARAQELAINPWQIFAARRRVWLESGAAAAAYPTLSAAQLVSLTATTAVPRVTITVP